MLKIIGKKNKVHYVEETTRLQMVKSHKGWLVIGASMFALGLGVLVTSRPVSADVVATSTSSSAVNAEMTGASSSSAVNAETTSASSSSAVNAETTSASSSSAVNAETTSANNSSAVNAEMTGASSSSAVNAETTSASSSSAVNAETTSANNSSAVNAETTSAKSLETSSSLPIHANQVSSDSVSGVTMEEISAINRFLEEKPIDKKLTTLGTTNPATVVDDYKFPTDGSQKSFLYSLGTPIRLTEDENKFIIMSGSDDIVKIKDIEQVEFYSLPSGRFPSQVVAKQITVVDGNGTEEIINNPAIDRRIVTRSDFGYIAKDQFIADFPIELHDPRLNVTTYDISVLVFYHGDQSYWGISIPYLEELPYDTVVQIDEKLKSGEVIVDSPGKFGKKTIDFKVYFDTPLNGYFGIQNKEGTVNASNYMDFTSDRLVNETRELGKQWSKPNEEIGSLVDAQHTITTKNPPNYRDYQQGSLPRPDQYGSIPRPNIKPEFILSEDRRLRVGIDYTHFVDTEGNTLSETEYGLKELKEIPGYIYKDTREEENGDSTHIYTKDPVAGGNVTVKYVDGAGNTISDNVVKSGNIGDDYSTDQKAIPGYTFKEVQGSASGQFTDQEQTVTYVYTKDPVAGGNVTVKYVDGAGNTISDNVVKSGNIGDDYSTDQKAIPGYTFKEVQGSASGKFTAQDQTVYYVYTKNAPTITTDKKTVNETIHYQGAGNQTPADHTASVDFTRQVSTDAVTGEKTYGAWSEAQSFDAVTSPELKGYTADKAQIDKQTVNGDSKDLAFTVTYTKNAPTITTDKKTVNETVSYVDQNGTVLAQPHTASVDFTRQVSTDAVTGEKTYGAWSEAQSFDAVTSPELKGYTADKAQIDKQTVNGDSKDLEFTVTYTKIPGSGTDTGNPRSNQPGNPSQPSNATNNGVINTSTNTGSKVNNGAVNSPELPQTGENNSQSQTMSFIGILLAMFGSLLGFLGIKKRRND